MHNWRVRIWNSDKKYVIKHNIHSIEAELIRVESITDTIVGEGYVIYEGTIQDIRTESINLTGEEGCWN